MLSPAPIDSALLRAVTSGGDPNSGIIGNIVITVRVKATTWLGMHAFGTNYSC